MLNLIKYYYFIIFTITFTNSPIICDSTIITNVNFLFETFSPSNLIRFFEFSDKEWNINEICIKDMYHYLEGLQKGLFWAIKLYDSSGYYGGANFGGYQFRISNPEQCRQLQYEYLKALRNHWTFKLNTSTVIPFPVHLISAKYEIELATKLSEVYTVQQSICFPKSCKNDDFKEILSTNFFRSNHIVKNMTLMNFRVINENYNIFNDSELYILISILSISIIFLICAHFSEFWSFLDEEIICDGNNCKMIKNEKDDNSTFSVPSDLIETKNMNCTILDNCTKLSKSINQNGKEDDKNSVTKLNMHPLAESMTINNINSNSHVNMVKVKKVKMKNTATISLDILAGNCDYAKSLPKSSFNKNNLIQEILSAFSLQSNYNNLIKRTSEENEIATVRGVQFICSILMILANTCVTMDYISNNQIIERKNFLDFITMSRKYASYLIDTFFFLSGTNLTLLYFKTNCKNTLETVEQLLHFVGMIAHKICSLIIPYIIVIICLELFSKYSHENIIIEIPSIDYKTCEITKWKNILFIDTFFPIDQRCMPWTWFISFEVQFFFAACLVLLLAQIHPKYAGAICTGLFMTCIMASIIIEMKIPSRINLWKNFENELADFNLIFDKVWLRIPSYLLGMCLGYILYKTRGKLEINIFVIVFGWIACFLIFIGFSFGFQFVFWQLNPWLKATIITLAHTIWSMILFWMIVASISQYGGLLFKVLTSNCFNILGKLSNCTFLLSPLLIRIVILNGENGIYSSNIHTIVIFLGISVLCFAFSLLLHLLFEAPLMALLKIVYKYKNNLEY